VGHSDKKYVLTVCADYQIYSIKETIKEGKTQLEFYGGITLSKDDENAGSFKDALQLYINQMMELKSKSVPEIKDSLKDAFAQYFQAPKSGFDQKELEKRLMDRVKTLNTKGKFDAANQLIDKMKKIPPKLGQAFRNAENAVKHGEYKEAEKEFETATRYAEELEEKDLVKLFKERTQLARRIPDLLKKKDENVERALQSMRNDNFNDAEKFFKQASEICRDLMDTRHAEEYGLKAKALSEYNKVDKKFGR